MLSSVLHRNQKWIFLFITFVWMGCSYFVKGHFFRPWEYSSENIQTENVSERQELVELLDRIVRHQHYYRQVYGRYTKFLNRTGIWIPRKISALYEIRVHEATNQSLLVTAVSEDRGRVRDRIAIDEQFRLTANFKIPEPRETYLKALAERAVRRLAAQPAGQMGAKLAAADRGVFRGYYQFEIQNDTKGGVAVVATGVRAPVLNGRIEYRAQSNMADADGKASDWEGLDSDQQFRIPKWVEQFSIEDLENPKNQDLSQWNTLEEAFLAKKIFEGEIGRQPRNWDELQWIGDFGFEGKQSVLFEKVPTDVNSLEALRGAKIVSQSTEVKAASRMPASESSQLIIEEIKD